MTAKTFKPTPLDMALRHDPAAQASEHSILAAADEAAQAATNELVANPALMPVQGQEATRQGQLVTAAASLAAGMIAAEGQPITPAMAVEKVRAVMDEMDDL